MASVQILENEATEQISKQTVSHLVVEIVKAVLYIRGQLPLPLDQIKRIVRGYRTKVTPFGDSGIYHDKVAENQENLKQPVRQNSMPFIARQQLHNTVAKFDKFLTDLLQLLQEGHVLEVVLSLGSNFMIPNEIYQIKLPPLCHKEKCISNPSVFQKSKQRVLRNLFNTDSILRNAPSEKLVPIYIMLLMSPNAKLTGVVEYKRHYRIPKSSKMVVMQLDWSCGHVLDADQRPEDSKEPERQDISADTVWVKLKSDLKGLPDKILDL